MAELLSLHLKFLRLNRPMQEFLCLYVSFEILYMGGSTLPLLCKYQP